MADIALFHSLLGVRPGVLDAADRLRARGHQVHVVDQYDGRVFDDYGTAGAFVDEHGGYPPLMQRALDGVTELPDGFLCVGFSNGGGMSEYVASRRAVGGVVLCSGALPLHELGVDSWPRGVPAQIHCTERDPFRREGWAESVIASVEAAGGRAEPFTYPGEGHLFTDASLPAEYDRTAAEQLWERVYAFCADNG